LYIIDFGFSKRWIKEDQVDPSKKRNTIIGTANFISVAVHNYCEPERKDDMESIIYIMMYLYMNELPWSTKELTHEQVKEIKYEFISRYRTEIDFIALLVNYIQTIQACIGKPDYELYICNFKKIIEKYK
jgi:serine/threonine protein kinase